MTNANANTYANTNAKVTLTVANFCNAKSDFNKKSKFGFECSVCFYLSNNSNLFNNLKNATIIIVYII
jgi:hypothetical protein